MKLSCELCPNEDTNKCNICQIDMRRGIESMNIEELLDRADKRIAEVEKIKNIRNSIKDIKTIEGMLKSEISLIKLQQGNMEVRMDMIIENDEYKELKEVIENKLGEFIQQRTDNLKQLLDHHQSTPIDSETKTAADKEIKQAINNIFGTEIISIPSDSWNAPEDKSLSKYPAPKRDKRKKYPENMTENVVRKMYVDEGKSKKEIAEYFGVKESTVNNFLYLKGIRRKSKKECP